MLDVKVKWKGIAQEIKKGGASKIEFSSIMFKNQNIPQFAFWEKLITVEYHKNFTVQADIEYKDL